MANSATQKVLQANAIAASNITEQQKPVSVKKEVDEKEQAALKAAVDSMVEAFNSFHSEIEKLRKEQQDVIKHINERLDKKKIEQIQEALKNSSQE